MTPDPLTQDPIPDRDLPAASRARMRARIAAVADEPVGRHRTAPLLAAAGLTAAVAVGVVMLPGPAPDSTPDSGVAANLETPSEFPGTSAAEAAEIERGCARMALEAAGDGSGLDALGPEGITDTVGTMRLRNLVKDEVGRYALVVGKSIMVGCTVVGPGDYRGVPQGLGDHLPGQDRGPTVDIIKGAPGAEGRPGTMVLAGRLRGDEVTEVVVNAEGVTMDASVKNDTYLARIVLDTDYVPHEMPAGSVTFTNADGSGSGIVIN